MFIFQLTKQLNDTKRCLTITMHANNILLLTLLLLSSHTFVVMDVIFLIPLIIRAFCLILSVFISTLFDAYAIRNCH